TVTVPTGVTARAGGDHRARVSGIVATNPSLFPAFVGCAPPAVLGKSVELVVPATYSAPVAGLMNSPAPDSPPPPPRYVVPISFRSALNLAMNASPGSPGPPRPGCTEPAVPGRSGEAVSPST